MRVLMISDVYFPRINGVSTSIHAFRRDLAALGCETVLVAPAYPAGWSDDASTHRIPSRYLPFDPEDRLMVCRRLLETLHDLSTDCDLIHIQTPFFAHRAGVRLARESGLPAIETYHTFFEAYLHHYLPFLPKGLLRLAASRFSRPPPVAGKRR